MTRTVAFFTSKVATPERYSRRPCAIKTWCAGRPYRHVFFDCDSNLTRVEGIDVLAEQAGRAESVQSLTEAAMNGEVDLEDVHGERLAQINPTRTQIQALRQVYKDNAVADAKMVSADASGRNGPSSSFC